MELQIRQELTFGVEKFSKHPFLLQILQRLYPHPHNVCSPKLLTELSSRRNTFETLWSLIYASPSRLSGWAAGC